MLVCPGLTQGNKRLELSMDARGKVVGKALSLTLFWSPPPGTAMDLAFGCEALTVDLLTRLWDPGDLG